MLFRSIALLLSSLCVVSTAGPAAAEVKAGDVAGRWHVDRVYMLTRDTRDCDAGECGLTLDVVACGEGWCGIEVAKGNACGATALRFDAAKTRPTEAADAVLFGGTLELARGTEPYVVEAYLRPAAEGAPAELSLTGDTGGEFRIYRRSFPFHATLARTGEASCTLEKPVG